MTGSEMRGKERKREKLIRREQDCYCCPDRIGHIAGVYRLVGNDIPVPRSVCLRKESRG